MTRILRSIALRFPLLLGGIVLAVAVTAGRLAHSEIGSVLIDGATRDLGDGAAQVAQMLAAGIPAARRALTEAARHPDFQHALGGLGSDADANAAVQRYRARATAGNRVAVRLLSAAGEVRGSWVGVPGASSLGWTIGAVRQGALSRDSATVGPVVTIGDTLPGYVAVAPVVSPAGELLGWLEEVHSARGQGVASVRALIGAERLLLGSRSWPVWTDLSRILPGPEFTDDPGTLQRALAADGTPVLGLARNVPETPWLVWVERPEADVMAPIAHFLRRMWLATLLIAVAGAGLAWVLGRYLASRIRVVAVELDRTLTSRDVAVEVPAPDDAADELRQLEQSYAALEARVERRRRFDEQLLQAQKLEAVGRLAGGIAHDFNNLLTVMTSYGAMAREGLRPDSPAALDLDEVMKAIDRATALTRQLLAFSRHRISDLRPLDINDVVRRTDSMLVRLMPSNVQHVLDLAPELPFVEADQSQIEQVLINFVVNAVDAMPDGGRVTVRTTRERVMGLHGGDASGAEHDSVCLAVTDSGVGMDAATMERIFDPFFTTKPLGKGTGLGLATVHGIVQGLGGRVVPYSEPGTGTTMRVYLPVAVGSEPTLDVAKPTPFAQPPLAPGLIAVAEDDPDTRAVIRRILQAAGHRVEDFATADACIDWLRTCPDTGLPLAVITDAMMPGTNGIAFTKLMRERHPQVPVVLVSGYADVRERIPTDLASRPVIIEKPFTATALHDALRRAVAPPKASAREQ